MLRLDIPSGICAKLRTVAASNNRVHMPWSLYYCLFAPHICMVLFFTHIPFVVNHTINATPPERLQQPSSYSVTSDLLILWYTTASSARFLYLLFSRLVLFGSCCDFSICPWVRLLLANVCNKWKFWSCTWQLCIRWMALHYVTHDGPQSLKSNFHRKIASELKNWFIIVNCVVFNVWFALNILKINYLQ